MAGRFRDLIADEPRITDFVDHMTTVFPEVRLKRYLEMRGADCGPFAQLCALPALWVGLLYDSSALDQASRLIADWTLSDHETLRREVPRTGLKTAFRGGSVRDVALEVLKIARSGLQARGALNKDGADETRYLDALDEIAQANRTLSDQLLEAYETRWNRSVDPVYAEQAF
jgi:glutamate--cysteine ligase